MNQPHAITFTATLQRKAPRLPVYVVVPHDTIAPWQLEATTVVEGTANGVTMGRRTIKRWDASAKAAWFIEFTAPFCQRAGISVGDRVTVVIVRAAADVPVELGAALAQAPAARAAWDELSGAKQRAVMEHVRAGQSAATRERRAALAAQRLAP